ncbi:transposase [Mesorhizobium sp. M0174]
MLDDLKKALSERVLNAELDDHLDEEQATGLANRRNGHSKKTVLTGTSKLELSIPRDRPAPSTRSWSQSISAAFPISTPRSYPCMRAA